MAFDLASCSWPVEPLGGPLKRRQLQINLHVRCISSALPLRNSASLRLNRLFTTETQSYAEITRRKQDQIHSSEVVGSMTVFTRVT
jgi:hypothetical protein